MNEIATADSATLTADSAGVGGSADGWFDLVGPLDWPAAKLLALDWPTPTPEALPWP